MYKFLAKPLLKEWVGCAFCVGPGGAPKGGGGHEVKRVASPLAPDAVTHTSLVQNKPQTRENTDFGASILYTSGTLTALSLYNFESL
jgi:hypothetical protein